MMLHVAHYDEHIPDQKLLECGAFGINVDVRESMEPCLTLCSRLHALGRRGVVWMSFYGYDNDPREVWDIPEVIAWSKEFLDKLGPTMSVLGNDLESKKGPGLGIVGTHVVAGYGKVMLLPNGLFDLSVPNLVLQRILEVQKS